MAKHTRGYIKGGSGQQVWGMEEYVMPEPRLRLVLQELGVTCLDDVKFDWQSEDPMSYTMGAACMYITGDEAPRLMRLEDIDHRSDAIFGGKRLTTVDGCFCPPHRGHYDMMAETALQVDVIIIHSMNTSLGARHGTPKEHTVVTWMDWCRSLTCPPYNTSFLIMLGTRTDLISTKVPDTVAGIYNNIVVEGMTREEAVALLRKLHGYALRHYKLVTPEHREEFRTLEFVVERPIPAPYSATNFVRALLDASDDCLRFVPEQIGDEAVRSEYVAHIRETYGTHLVADKWVPPDVEEEEADVGNKKRRLAEEVASKKFMLLI
jgi:hypothetical protein